MNRKIIKQINKQVPHILVAWLHTLVSEEEAKMITLNNYKELLPDQTHVFSNNKFFLSTFSPRWVRKKLKGLVVANPDRPINSFTLEDIKAEMQTWKMINRDF
jgi:hypothetical protein